MSCAEALRVQAYFDGELSTGEIASVVRHLAECAGCRSLLADLERGRATLRSSMPQTRAPAELRARIKNMLDEEAAKPARGESARRPAWTLRSFWFGALVGTGLSGLAAALMIFIVLPLAANPVADELLTAHLQSLTPNHLISVASSEHHTVKPWFAGRADVSPTVADFSAQGFTLTGGRADRVLGQRAAVVVYRHGLHTINVFTWANKQTVLPHDTTRSGYRMLFWRSADLAYCAVSDTGWDELREFARLLQAQTAAENGAATP